MDSQISNSATINTVAKGSPVLGFVLAVTIGLVSYWVSTLHQSLEALAVALLLGVAVRGLLGNNPGLGRGIRLATQLFIPLGVILYGVRLDIPLLGNLAAPIILRTLINMGLFFLIVFALSHWWPIRRATRTLLAAGSAICGASAIVVLSPVADAEPEDTSVSLIVVTTVGLLGAMLFPILKASFGWSDQLYAVLSGSTLQQTATVKLAVEGLSKEIIDYALAVKMVRVIMLIPVAFSLAWFNRSQETSRVQVLGQVWFVFVFAAVGALVSFTPLHSLQSVLAPWSTIVLTLAMASIGLTVNLDAVVNAGLRPLLIGLFVWLAVFVFFVLSTMIFPIR